MARPRKDIDWNEVKKLAELFITQEEIASFCDVCLDTLQTACKRDHGVSFSEFYHKYQANGKISAKRRAFAMVGKNPAVTIFWLKNHCGMRDSTEIVGDSERPVTITLVNNIPGMGNIHDSVST
jgi:hypothetical protein